MPTKDRYKKILLAKNKCPKCGGLKKRDEFVTCNSCRTERSKEQRLSEIRKSAMALFTGKNK